MAGTCLPELLCGCHRGERPRPTPHVWKPETSAVVVAAPKHRRARRVLGFRMYVPQLVQPIIRVIGAMTYKVERLYEVVLVEADVGRA